MHLSVINLKIKIIRDFQDFVLSLTPKNENLEITEILQECHNTEIWGYSFKNKLKLTGIVQIAYYPTCLFRENKNVPLFYFLPLSLKLTKPYALVFPITILNIWNYEKQCYYDKLLGTFLEQGMVSCFLKGGLKFLRFFKTIYDLFLIYHFHCYSSLITNYKDKLYIKSYSSVGINFIRPKTNERF